MISLVVLLVVAGLGEFCWGPGPCLVCPPIGAAGFGWDTPRPQGSVLDTYTRFRWQRWASWNGSGVAGQDFHPFTHIVSIISRASFVWRSCHCHSPHHQAVISLVVLLVVPGLGEFCWGPGPCLVCPPIGAAGFGWDAPRPQAFHSGILTGPCSGISRTWGVWGYACCGICSGLGFLYLYLIWQTRVYLAWGGSMRKRTDGMCDVD